MSKLVIELQKEALDKNINASDLLRKALLVATKLNVEDIRTWIEKELNGYETDDIYPKYRIIEGQLKARNVFNQYKTVEIENLELAEELSKRDIYQSIGEIEAIIKTTDKSDRLSISIPSSIFGTGNKYEFSFVLTKHQLYRITDSVKNIILKWSLQLEKDGIIGEGISFSETEKNIANNNVYNIQTFTGVIGNINSSNIQIGDYNSIHSKLKELGVSQEERNLLENIFDDLKAPVKTDKQSIIKRGYEWLKRNAGTIGSLSETIRIWLEYFKS